LPYCLVGNMKTRFYCILLHTMLLASGCSFLQPDIMVTLRPPELPEKWRETFPRLDSDEWYVDGSGNIAHTGIRQGWREISVPLYKGYNSFVLIYPIIAGRDIRLPPAGAVFPLQLERECADTLVLTWEAGVAASVYERLWRQGIDISCFNTARLLEVMKERAPADPWAIDINLIAERIAAHDFSVYDVKLLPARDVALDVPGGNWFLESPFALTQHNEPGSALGLTAVCYGFHRLFAADGSMRFDFCVSETDCVVISP
jgi:hypothetical protein